MRVLLRLRSGGDYAAQLAVAMGEEPAADC